MNSVFTYAVCIIVCFRKGVKEREKKTDTAATAAAPENVPPTDYTPTRPQHGRGSSSSTFFLVLILSLFYCVTPL